MPSVVTLRNLVLTIAIIAASIVLAVTIVGTGRIVHSLLHPRYSWIALLIAAQVLAYIGYALAYKSLFGMRLKWATRNTLYGFSPLVALGGFAYDAKRVRNRYRVVTLGASEYAVLAPLAWVAAIATLVGGTKLALVLAIPWVIGFPVGLVVAAAIIKWRLKISQKIALFLNAYLKDCWSLSLRKWLVLIIGLSVYWAGELLALWAALRLFDARISAGALVLAFASGYVLTQRASPASFSGLIILVLMLMLHLIGVPFGAAFLATYSFLTVSILLPLLYLVITRRNFTTTTNIT